MKTQHRATIVIINASFVYRPNNWSCYQQHYTNK